jgi:hypothetical protein
MNLQLASTIVIVFCALVLALVKVYRSLRRVSKNELPCTPEKCAVCSQSGSCSDEEFFATQENRESPQ